MTRIAPGSRITVTMPSLIVDRPLPADRNLNTAVDQGESVLVSDLMLPVINAPVGCGRLRAPLPLYRSLDRGISKNTRPRVHIQAAAADKHSFSISGGHRGGGVGSFVRRKSAATHRVKRRDRGGFDGGGSH